MLLGIGKERVNLPIYLTL